MKGHVFRTPLSKVLKRVYVEGGSSEGNVECENRWVLRKKFWDFLGAGVQSYLEGKLAVVVVGFFNRGV